MPGCLASLEAAGNPIACLPQDQDKPGARCFQTEAIYFLQIEIFKIMDMPIGTVAVTIDPDLISPNIFDPAQIMKNHAMLMLPTKPVDNGVVPRASHGQDHEPLFHFAPLTDGHVMW
jgi:hypothetical protein